MPFEAKAKVIRLYTLEELSKLPAPKFLVEGILPERSFSAIYGPSNVGKTFWILHLALCVATGMPFLGHDVILGNVLYVAAEGVGGLSARLEAWKRHYGLDPKDRFRVVPEALIFKPGGDINKLMEVLQKDGFRPDLSIFDTLARSFEGDENSTADMNKFVAVADAIRAWGTAVCVVHHSGKDRRKGARGNSALLAALDLAVVIDVTSSRIMTATCEKQKDARPFPRLSARLEEVSVSDDEERTSAVLVSAKDDGGAAEPLTPTERTALFVLRRAQEGNEDMTTVSTADWISWCADEGLTKRRTAEAAIEGLCKKGMASKPRRGVYALTTATADEPQM